MKAKEYLKKLHTMSLQELDRELQESKKKLQQLNFDLAAGKLKNVREIRKVKRNIAKILTIRIEKSRLTK